MDITLNLYWMNTMIVFLSSKNSLQIYLASIQFKDMEGADMQNQPRCPPFEGRQHYCCQICSTPGSCASGITLVVCLLVDQLLHCIVFLRAGIVLERLDVFIVTMRGRNSAHNIPTFNEEVQMYFCMSAVFLYCKPNLLCHAQGTQIFFAASAFKSCATHIIAPEHSQSIQ